MGVEKDEEAEPRMGGPTERTNPISQYESLMGRFIESASENGVGGHG
jgi:hypothetical protein